MGRRLTTPQIAQLLPDVPMPSLYRHVRLLAEAGVLTPVEEVRVNGALVKVYAVQEGGSRIGPTDIHDATRTEHLRYFTTFLNTLAESFRVSLEQEAFDLSEIPLHALMEPLHLSAEEYRQFLEAFRAFLQPWHEKPAGGGRNRLLFAHIILPDRPDPPLS